MSLTLLLSRILVISGGFLGFATKTCGVYMGRFDAGMEMARGATLQTLKINETNFQIITHRVCTKISNTVDYMTLKFQNFEMSTKKKRADKSRYVAYMSLFFFPIFFFTFSGLFLK